MFRWDEYSVDDCRAKFSAPAALSIFYCGWQLGWFLGIICGPWTIVFGLHSLCFTFWAGTGSPWGRQFVLQLNRERAPCCESSLLLQQYLEVLWSICLVVWILIMVCWGSFYTINGCYTADRSSFFHWRFCPELVCHVYWVVCDIMMVRHFKLEIQAYAYLHMLLLQLLGFGDAVLSVS